MFERSAEASETVTAAMSASATVEELKSRFAQLARHVPPEVEPAVSFALRNASLDKAK